MWIRSRLTKATECPNCWWPRPTTFDYFMTGQLQDEVRSWSQVTSYQYNLNGDLRSITYPSGRLVSYTVDPVTGKPTEINATYNGTSTPILSDISYYAFGPVKSATYGNGRELGRTYDLRYRISSNSVLYTNGTDIDVDYAYDYETNITSITGTYGRGYTYDDSYRLLSGTALSYWDTESYTYDLNGNRLTKITTNGNLYTTYRYQTGTNLLLQTSGSEPNSFTYNARGDITADNYYAYSYGDHKRLISVDDTSQQNIAFYTYDYRLRRVSYGGQYSLWGCHYSQDDRLISETDNYSSNYNDYIYLGIESIAKIEYNGDVDTLYYYYNDHLMTPLIMQDASGSTVWQAQYYPFGNLFSESNAMNNLRFPGQYDDRIPNASLFYNWNRFYSPVIGRYFQTDPILYKNEKNICLQDFNSSNLFTYSNNNSIINIDPNGEQWWKWAIHIAAAGYAIYSAWQCQHHIGPCQTTVHNCRERYDRMIRCPELQKRTEGKSPNQWLWDCITGSGHCRSVAQYCGYDIAWTIFEFPFWLAGQSN